MRVFITGAYSGIGFETAKRLAIKGHSVTIGVHTEKEMDNVKEKIRKYPRIGAIKFDLANKDDFIKINKMKIDCYIANAGMGVGGSISEIDMNLVRNNFEINVFSSFEFLQKVIKKMIKQESGKIIIISSLIEKMPLEFLGVYASTKASITVLAETLRKEIKYLSKSIHVSVIEPGTYHTGFNQVMLENKYTWMNKKSYFKNHITKINDKETTFFSMMEVKNKNSVINKIEKCVEAEKPRFLYRAPWWQAFGVKLYNLFFR